MLRHVQHTLGRPVHVRRLSRGCAASTKYQIKAGSMPITIHHLNDSRSQKVIWLLEELGVADYKVIRYERLPTKLAPPDLKDVHPLGKAPVLEDKGKVIAETSLIFEYLIDEYGPHLAPPKEDKDAYLRYKYWLHYAEGTATPALVYSLLLNALTQLAPGTDTSSIVDLFVGPNIDLNTQYLDDSLAKSTKGWLLDDFSGADISISFILQLIVARSGLSGYPRLKEYLEKLEARPAYQRALERGGTFTPFA